tara:strand:- start:611 stop:997 length:387 start_codon:yes stop_codon:yes gene_type:complete
MKKIILIILLMLFINNCSQNNLDINNPEIRRAASKINIIDLDSNIPKKYQILSEVRGVSYGGQKTTTLGEFNTPPASKEEAYRELKLNAARVNADAIINVFCEDTGVDWSRNCWTTMVCIGDAIKIDE